MPSNNEVTINTRRDAISALSDARAQLEGVHEWLQWEYPEVDDDYGNQLVSDADSAAGLAAGLEFRLKS